MKPLMVGTLNIKSMLNHSGLWFNFIPILFVLYSLPVSSKRGGLTVSLKMKKCQLEVQNRLNIKLPEDVASHHK